MSWKDIDPDFLVFLIRVIAGIVLLIVKFSITILALVILILFLGFFGNAFVREQLACRYCMQRRIGCPAEEFFNQKKKQD